MAVLEVRCLPVCIEHVVLVLDMTVNQCRARVGYDYELVVRVLDMTELRLDYAMDLMLYMWI